MTPKKIRGLEHKARKTLFLGIALYEDLGLELTTLEGMDSRGRLMHTFANRVEDLLKDMYTKLDELKDSD